MSWQTERLNRGRSRCPRLLPYVASVATLLLGAASFAAEISTDKLVYQQGDTVKVTGQGWGSGETITLYFNNTAGTRAQQYQTKAGSDGTFSNSSFVLQALDTMLTLVAKGSTSGVQSMTAFRDSVAPGFLNCGTMKQDLQSPYNYKLSPRGTATCTIAGASDLSNAQQQNPQTVEVLVSNSLGVMPAKVTSVQNGTINFQYTAPTSACGEATVSYGPISVCDKTFGLCTTFPTLGNQVHANANCGVEPATGFKYVTCDGGITCRTCVPNTPSIIDTLGMAGPSQFAVLSLGGESSKPKAGIYCSNGTVNGNIGIAGYGTFTNMAPCVENGAFYKGTNVTYKGPGKLNGPTIPAEAMLDGLRDDAINAWKYFKGLPATEGIVFPADGNINRNITVTGKPGFNVINLPGLTLNGNLTFTGEPGTQFVLNINGTFNLHWGNITTSGNVGPYDVIYNIVDRSATVKTMVPTTAVGILLAPYNAINAMDSANFYGEIIGGYNQVITLMSGTRVVPPPPPPPCIPPKPVIISPPPETIGV